VLVSRGCDGGGAAHRHGDVGGARSQPGHASGVGRPVSIPLRGHGPWGVKDRASAATDGMENTPVCHHRSGLVTARPVAAWPGRHACQADCPSPAAPSPAGGDLPVCSEGSGPLDSDAEREEAMMAHRVWQEDHVDTEVDGVHLLMRLGRREEQQDAVYVGRVCPGFG
jgi:hypothetical protein